MKMKAGPSPRSSTLSAISPMSMRGMRWFLLPSLSPSQTCDGESESFPALPNLRHVDRTALASGAHAGLDHGEIARGPPAVGLGLTRTVANAGRELVDLLADGIVLLARDRRRPGLTLLQMAQAPEHIVVGARCLAVDVHHVM